MPAKWRTHVLHYVPPDAPPPTPQQRADALAVILRANGATELPTYVSGPFVVLDADAGVITVHCGAAAEQVAQSIGAKLADPSRPEVRCMVVGTSFKCIQLDSRRDAVILELEDLNQPHLTSAAAGSWRGSLAMQMSKLKAQVATAACP